MQSLQKIKSYVMHIDNFTYCNPDMIESPARMPKSKILLYMMFSCNTWLEPEPIKRQVFYLLPDVFNRSRYFYGQPMGFYVDEEDKRILFLDLKINGTLVKNKVAVWNRKRDKLHKITIMRLKVIALSICFYCSQVQVKNCCKPKSKLQDPTPVLSPPKIKFGLMLS